MKIKYFVFLIIVNFSFRIHAQDMKLNYPNPVKQIEKILKLPEKLDTLNQDYFLVYQFKIKNAKAVSIDLVHQFPSKIHTDYIQFAEEKLNQMDFSDLVTNEKKEWYGTSLRLKKKPVEYRKSSETQLSYEEKFTWISMSAARFAGLNSDDFEYMTANGHKDVIINVTVGTDGKMNFENLTENADRNKDLRYWEIYKNITDGIKRIRLWNDYKNPFQMEESFSLYFNFYKKMEWKEQ